MSNDKYLKLQGSGMARITLWSSNKGNDFKLNDRIAKEFVNTSGPAILIHKYLGTPEGDETTIQDVLFLENRDRNYDNDIRELRGIFRPNDVDYDLSQFGLFLSSDVVRFEFHYNEMIDKIGRKLMSGDVFEVPLERDQTIDGKYVNSYYVVQDALYSANGHGVTWYPHVWKVRAKKLPGAPEFRDILESVGKGDSIGAEGMGTGTMPMDWALTDDTVNINSDACSAQSALCNILGITDGIINEAENNVFYDPKFFETKHLYIAINQDGYPVPVYWHSGDGLPPNGDRLRGAGVAFPDDMKDGEYFLRVDYSPDRLFQRQGNRFKRIHDDLRRTWTAMNTRLDTYINNSNMTVLNDGLVTSEKQDIHTIASGRVDPNQDHKEELRSNEVKRKRISKKISDFVYCQGVINYDLLRYAEWIRPELPVPPLPPVDGGGNNGGGNNGGGNHECPPCELPPPIDFFADKTILNINEIKILSLDSPVNEPDIVFTYQFNIITEDGEFVSAESGQLMVTEDDYIVYIQDGQIKIAIDDKVFNRYGIVDRSSIKIDILSKAVYAGNT